MTTDWSVLLIGGTSAVGKSNAARRIAVVSGATLLHADDIRVALGLDLAPDGRLPLDAYRVTAEAVSTALERVIGHHLIVADKIVIEGLWITPELAARAAYAGTSGGERRRAVFVLEDPRERTSPISPEESARARWLQSETKRLSLPTVSARPVGHLAERILSVV